VDIASATTSGSPSNSSHARELSFSSTLNNDTKYWTWVSFGTISWTYGNCGQFTCINRCTWLHLATGEFISPHTRFPAIDPWFGKCPAHGCSHNHWRKLNFKSFADFTLDRVRPSPDVKTIIGFVSNYLQEVCSVGMCLYHERDSPHNSRSLTMTKEQTRAIESPLMAGVLSSRQIRLLRNSSGWCSMEFSLAYDRL
jgi:hypothetical protein